MCLLIYRQHSVDNFIVISRLDSYMYCIHRCIHIHTHTYTVSPDCPSGELGSVQRSVRRTPQRVKVIILLHQVTVLKFNIILSLSLSLSSLPSISEGLALKCTELLGCPMVYELVEYARECLTDNNLPCSHCAICQVQFQASSKSHYI